MGGGWEGNELPQPGAARMCLGCRVPAVLMFTPRRPCMALPTGLSAACVSSSQNAGICSADKISFKGFKDLHGWFQIRGK